jgi:hypothetical protein
MRTNDRQNMLRVVDNDSPTQPKGAGKGIKVKIMTEYFEDQHILRQTTIYKTLSTQQERIAEVVYKLKENDLTEALKAAGWRPPVGF